MAATLLPAPTRPTKPVKVKKAQGGKYVTEKVATPLTVPHMVTVFNPSTQREVKHLGYEATVQHTSKQDEVRVVLCSKLDTVRVGEPVMLEYHRGMRAYKHSRYMSVSNPDNCAGGFYFISGVEA